MLLHGPSPGPHVRAAVHPGARRLTAPQQCFPRSPSVLAPPIQKAHHQSFNCYVLPREGTRKGRPRLKVNTRALNWVSNLSVGLVIGGILGVILEGNLAGVLLVFAGVFTAFVTFDLFEEKGQ